MHISRRDFLKYCTMSASVLGFSATDLGHLEEALANPNAPTVLWLEGAGCTGCTISFLNRISRTAPTGVGDLIINRINLAYHPTLMAAAGDSAVAQAEQAFNRGNYILVVEGAVPTAFGGSTCWAWTYNGKDVTFLEAVTSLASKAASIICLGNCAGYGGVTGSGPNPTGAKSVSAVTGKKTINIPGCPPHPDWAVWAIAQLLAGSAVAVDAYGRPTGLFKRTVHSLCPRRERDEADAFGSDGYCLRELGCHGPETVAPCPTSLWNNGVNWCVGGNAPCIGCTDPSFPFTALLAGGEGGGGDD